MLFVRSPDLTAHVELSLTETELGSGLLAPSENLALAQSSRRSHQFGETRLFPAPKSTDLYRTPRMST